MQFLLCFQHFPVCLSSVLTFDALPHRSLRAVMEEPSHLSIASEIPFFLVIRLVSPLQFIRSNCHLHKETHHVLINFHHALQPPSLRDAGRRAADETGPTSRALIPRANHGLLRKRKVSGAIPRVVRATFLYRRRTAADVGGWRGHVHHFTGGPDRVHTLERNILCRRAQRDFPSAGFDNVHNGGRNQQGKECDRPELRRRVVDTSETDMPYR
jgi:hypothetical protein